MSDAVKIAIIVAIGPMVLGILNFALHIIIKKDVRKVEQATNHIKDELVESTDRAARSEGHAEGVAAERVRHSSGLTMADRLDRIEKEIVRLQNRGAGI